MACCSTGRSVWTGPIARWTITVSVFEPDCLVALCFTFFSRPASVGRDRHACFTVRRSPQYTNAAWLD